MSRKAKEINPAVRRLAMVNDAAAALHGAGHITELVRDHFVILATSDRDEPHPETGLPCHCGETHPVRTLIGEEVG